MLAESVKRSHSVVADAAVVVWALGIIAFELLTKTRVFVPFETGAAEVIDQLSGNKPLPWEGDRRGELLPKLKVRSRVDCSLLSCSSCIWQLPQSERLT